MHSSTQVLSTHFGSSSRRFLNSPHNFGKLYDCDDSRDGTGYKNVTDSDVAEVVAARKLMKKILADKPVPDVVEKPRKKKAAGKSKPKEKAT